MANNLENSLKELDLILDSPLSLISLIPVKHDHLMPFVMNFFSVVSVITNSSGPDPIIAGPSMNYNHQFVSIFKHLESNAYFYKPNQSDSRRLLNPGTI